MIKVMNKKYAEISKYLQEIEQHMRHLDLWQERPPSEEALASQMPFCVDTMAAEQWLQWILLPRMSALVDAQAGLPHHFAISPYFEVAYRERVTELQPLLQALNQFDQLFHCDENG